jgi:hypothetical protein
VDTATHSSHYRPLSAPLLESKEQRAPIAILTPAQCKALLVCLGAGALFRSRGAWGAEGDTRGQRISGITIADLGRDGMLTIDVSGKYKSARLTPKGSWFARTIASAPRDP